MSTVFISYSHKDEKWKDRLLPQLRALEQAGVDMHVWEDRMIDAGAKWHPAIEQAMKDASVAILLISADYLASAFCVKEEVPYLLGRQEQEGMLLIPVLVRKCPWKAHRWLASRQMLPRDGKCGAIDFSGDGADTVFCEVAEKVFDHFEKMKLVETKDKTTELPDVCFALRSPIKLKGEGPGSRQKYSVLPTNHIDLSRLPETGKALFGRDVELDLLDSVWAATEKDEATRTRIIAFIAAGGVGKSTLVNQWLRDMAGDNYRGAKRVFGWSFYSQGARDDGSASADSFIAAALEFFGGKEGKSLAESPALAWEKGDRLSRFVGEEQNLLVLDGMEPLQSPQTWERGKLRDPGLEALLTGLARQSRSACVITTREPLPDLAALSGVKTLDIDQITPEAGRALLRIAKVVGTDKELETLSGFFGPHALTISLLGVYLHEIDPLHGIAKAKELELLPGKNPIDRVLAGFEQWLADSPELEAVRLLGLFDRPASKGCIGALRAKPPIDGFTNRLTDLTEGDWVRVLDRLERLHLIHVRHKGSGNEALDAHPLIREYFAKQISEKNPKAWREGHRRLYEYLTTSTKDKPEPTLEELQPLYQAVSHGCKAGLYEEVGAKVYRDRILKGTGPEGFYITRKLGAFGANLGVVACFFEEPWKKLSPVNAQAQAWLLNEAAFSLCALGRVSEAIEPMRGGIEGAVRLQDWKNAAIYSSNLSEFEVTLGDLEAATQDGRKSVEFADKSGNAFQRMASRTTLADSLHQANQRDEAIALFREAETIQAKRQPENPLLYSLSGFRNCDLLLAGIERRAWKAWKNYELKSIDNEIAVCREVEKRAVQTIKIAKSHKWPLDIAHDHLTLGRVAFYLSILDPSDSGHHQSAIDNIHAAVNVLYASGNQDELPRGLLTRSWLRFLENDPSGSRADLDEARQIADRGSMRLHLADVHLYRGRLFKDKSEIAKARSLIEKCGYWRRKEELEDAEGAV